MDREKGTTRKVRNDKKMDVKPTMSMELKDQLYRFAHICEEPVKDVAERICVEATTSLPVIEDIRNFFRRDYKWKNHITVGYDDRPRLKLLFKGETSRVTIRFKQADYDRLYDVAYALDLTPSSTATVLIKRSLHNREFMEQYVLSHLRHLSDKRKNELRHFLNILWGMRYID